MNGETDRKLTSYLTKDLVDGAVTWQSTIEDTELSFEPLWNVVSATSRVNHGRQELNVCQVSKVTWLLQVIETFVLHNLTNYFIRYLKNNKTWVRTERNLELIILLR